MKHWRWNLRWVSLQYELNNDDVTFNCFSLLFVFEIVELCGRGRGPRGMGWAGPGCFSYSFIVSSNALFELLFFFHPPLSKSFSFSFSWALVYKSALRGELLLCRVLNNLLLLEPTDWLTLLKQSPSLWCWWHPGARWDWRWGFTL